MEARLRRIAIGLVLVVASSGASYSTPNFIIHCPDEQLARELGEAAEKYRKELALLWLGKTLPDWSRPCPVTVHVGPQLGAGGATTFVFDRGEVYGWRMTIQGSRERLLDSVLPHEITHMILASHFRRPLPRWADEGAATTVEHISEREKHRRMLLEFLRTRRGIPFRHMFAMEEYPRDIMPLYAQGYTLAEFLIQQGGHQRFVKFLEDGLNDNNWDAALTRWYNISDLGQLQLSWVAWVDRGFPQLNPPATPTEPLAAPLLAANDTANWRAKDGPSGVRASIYQQAAAMVPDRAAASHQSSIPNRSANAWSASDSLAAPSSADPGPPLVDVTGWRPARDFSPTRVVPVSQTDLSAASRGSGSLNGCAAAPNGDRMAQETARVNALGYAEGASSERVLLEWSRPTVWR